MPATVTTAELASLVGADLGPGKWVAVDQERISTFSDVTGDHQYIHTDPEAAARTPFGGTIAQGFLTLSLLTHLTEDLLPAVEGQVMGINYGLNKVRFITPVRSGGRVRARATFLDAAEKGPGRYLMTYNVVVEIEGEENPALIAEWLVMSVTG